MRWGWVVLFLVLAACILLAGCTDATVGKLKALGSSAHIECYSGGTLIYDGRSTGKVKSETNSDGYFFVDRETGLPMEVSGNCVITYDDAP